MDEREIIRLFRNMARAGGSGDSGHIETGPGDDAACVRLPGGALAVLSTDMVIEGVHFRSDAEPEEIAFKAIGRALSDLAAMAARPVCSLVATCFPEDVSDSYKETLCSGLHHHAASMGAPLAGGDTGSGSTELSITVTVVGVEGPGGLVYRSGAQPGDAICVTGALGGSLSGRHLTPEPLIQHALELAACCDVHAMIDISDGLSTDLLHIAEESGVGVSIQASAIPVHPDALEMAEREGGGERGALLHALNDGEDYQLLFCLPENQASRLVSTGIRGVDVSIIGNVTESLSRVIIGSEGTETELEDTGWRHLRNK